MAGKSADPQVRERAIELVKQGASYRTAAEAVGSSYASVKLWTQEAGVASTRPCIVCELPFPRNRGQQVCDLCRPEAYDRAEQLRLSKRRRRQSKGQVSQGEPEKTCEHCGSQFKSSRKAARFCSNRCGAQARSAAASRTLTCEVCGTEFKDGKPRADRGPRRYCGRQCYHEGQRKASQEKAQREKAQKETRECPVCGGQFEVPQWKKQRTCSRSCANKARTKAAPSSPKSEPEVKPGREDPEFEKRMWRYDNSAKRLELARRRLRGESVTIDDMDKPIAKPSGNGRPKWVPARAGQSRQCDNCFRLYEVESAGRLYCTTSCATADFARRSYSTP